MSTLPIIIDTDPGCDDAIALMFLLAQQSVDIRAITTVAGNGPIETVTRNASFILRFCQQAKLPLFVGAAAPLQRSLVTAVVHGESGLGAVTVPQTEPVVEQESAVDALVRLAATSPGELTILAIGPLTNIAQALDTNPDFEKQVKELIIMGGAVDVPGNKSPYAEFNFFVDPEATARVFESHIPKTLIPLDLCNQAILSKQEITELATGKLSDIIMQLLIPYADLNRQEDGLDGAVMYDVLAAYYLLARDRFTTETMSLAVEIADPAQAGMVIKNDDTTQTTVATAVDMSAFKQDLRQALVNLAQTI